MSHRVMASEGAHALELAYILPSRKNCEDPVFWTRVLRKENRIWQEERRPSARRCGSCSCC